MNKRIAILAMALAVSVSSAGAQSKAWEILR